MRGGALSSKLSSAWSDGGGWGGGVADILRASAAFDHDQNMVAGYPFGARALRRAGTSEGMKTVPCPPRPIWHFPKFNQVLKKERSFLRTGFSVLRDCETVTQFVMILRIFSLLAF
ncbi:hypothetical protein [Sphingopyxis sp. 113P3]|uniref:hypothetical protein n=1 Tax=Sphingopyxis sp. (strain 113P3) TaxID=292913 RepID=UPI001F1903C2|nr:hypothetical protein [Sphingopyxis sp. 113P3]